MAITEILTHGECREYKFYVSSRFCIDSTTTIPGYSYSTKLKLAFAVANSSIYDSMHFENFYDIKKLGEKVNVK